MQTDAALVSGVATGVATLGLVEGELTLVVGVMPSQIPVDVLVRRLGVLLEWSRVEELGAIFLEEMLHLLAGRHVRLLAFAAEPLGEPLREDSKQGVGEIERIHAHVQK